MSRYLLADVGSTYTKTALVDVDGCEVLAVSAAPTTVQTDVNAGLDAAAASMGVHLDDVRDTLVCSSAAGGLRIAAVGLVPSLTMKAARLAALGAGGKVVGAYSFRLNDGDINTLLELAPDIILLAGGTDGGNSKNIVENARRLASAMPATPVIVAGNRDAEDEVRAVLSENPDVRFVPNVMPEMDRLALDPAREAIRQVFLERIVRSKGLHRLEQRARILMPTPNAVLSAVRLLSEGAGGEAGLGDLVAVDMGGATTDVYSCAEGLPRSSGTVLKGLREPRAKRTVEADIGMAWTLRYLIEQMDAARVAAEASVTEADFAAWAASVDGERGLCPRSAEEERVVLALARAGVELAMTRHAGRLEETYTPNGRVYLQEGKDLSSVRVAIGSGGPLVRTSRPGYALGGVAGRDSEMTLRPLAPEFFVDSKYVMWAAGLLAETEPVAAIRIMKRYLQPAEGDR